MKKLKPFILMTFALLALFSFGTVEPVGATECVINFAYEHIEFAPALGAIPLMANIVKEQCTISAAELDALKAKYGKIKILSVVIEPPVCDDKGKVTNPGEVYYFAVRRPDQGHVRMLMDYAKKGEIDSYIKAFINNLIVAGDKEVLENDGLVYLGFSSKVDEYLKPYESFLSNA